MTYISCLLLWILGLSPQTDSLVAQGAWRQRDVKWNRPPAKLHLKERYAEAALLYFGANDAFSIVYATVIQGPKSEGVSRGDGQVVCLGKWKSEGVKLRVEFRLVSRTVQKQGEVLPGPVEQAEVNVQDDFVLFQNMRFKRDKELDNDLLAIFQGESARFRSEHLREPI